MDVINFLEKNVKPATGCTEPASVGLATSLAYNALFGNLPNSFKGDSPKANYENVEQITIYADRNVYKNALSVAIPGTNGQKGMAIAAAMGLFCDPKNDINLFESIDSESIELANKLLDSGKVVIADVEDKSSKSDLDVRVELIYKINDDVDIGYARLQHEHSNITEIKVNNNLLYRGKKDIKSEDSEPFPETLDELISISKNLNEEERNRVYEGIIVNKNISETGLKESYGLELGKKLEDLVEKGVIQDSLISKVMINAAAAGDARMGGAKVPVMSTAGSGNQGITALVPIYTVGEEMNVKKDKIIEGAMLSHLVTKYISNYSGYLSALCGCTIKAGVGAAAGVTYVLGGDNNEISNSINILAANLPGVICDGAKEGCSLKLANAASKATESAFLAKGGMKVTADNGIVAEKAEDTMKNIGRLAKAMIPTDIEIVNIMQDKDDFKEVDSENIAKGPSEDPFSEILMQKSHKKKKNDRI